MDKKNKQGGRITIKQVKSAIGYSKKTKDTLRTLGLRRINHVVSHNETQSILGMIKRVKHLVILGNETKK